MRRLCSWVLLIGVLAAFSIPARAQDVRSLDRQGITLYQRGDYEEALQAFGQALEIAPHDGLTLVLEGTAMLATSDERGADDAWAEAANDNVRGSVADALSGFNAVAAAHKPPHRSASSHASVSSNPPGAGAPPSGAYRCMTSSVGTLYQMGQIVISGSTYRYAPTGGTLSAPASFSIDPATEHLHWHGSMGAITQAPSQLVDSWLERGDTYLSIIVKYRPQPNGYTFTMGCRNDLH